MKRNNTYLHLLVFFALLLIGYTIGYLIGTEKAILYGVVIAWVIGEIAFLFYLVLTEKPDLKTKK